MSKTRRTTTGPRSFTGAFPLFDMEALICAHERSLKSAAEAQEHFFQQIISMNRECFKFIESRLEQDREALKSLGSCNCPGDVMKVYGQFYHSDNISFHALLLAWKPTVFHGFETVLKLLVALWSVLWLLQSPVQFQ